MPRLSLYARIERYILARTDIKEPTKIDLLNGLGTITKRGKHARKASEWKELLDKVRRARDSAASNRTRWSAPVAELMEEYVGMLDRVATLVNAHVTEDDPRSITQYSKDFVNQCVKKGTISLYANTPRTNRWQSWIPDPVKADFCARYESAVTKAGLKRSAFIPFRPVTERTAFKAQVKRMRALIQRERANAADTPKATPAEARGSTPFKALILAACSQADRELRRREALFDASDMVDAPVIPVTMSALLSPEMRKRVRDAYANPHALTTDGLDSYLTVVLSSKDGHDGLYTPLSTTMDMDDPSVEDFDAPTPEPTPEPTREASLSAMLASFDDGTEEVPDHA